MTRESVTATRAVATSVLGVGDFVPDLGFHRRLSRRVGGESLTLAVGGQAVRLGGLTAGHVAVLTHRYGIFCSTPGEMAAEIVVGMSPKPAFLLPRRDSGEVEFYRVHTSWEENVLLATSYEWSGWYDRDASRGGLTLASVNEHDTRAFDRSFENFLRVLYAHLFVQRDGFLLHSAGLVRDGRAYLFFGPSGVGKTTVTALSPDATVLSDDLTLVLRDGETYGACSVPFRGVFAPQPETAQVFPVAGFFRLVQDTEDRLVRLVGARAVGEIVGSLPFVTERSEMAGDVIDTVALATGRIPVFELHFRKAPTFWEAIRNEAAIGPKSSEIDDFRRVRGIK